MLLPVSLCLLPPNNATYNCHRPGFAHDCCKALGVALRHVDAKRSRETERELKNEILRAVPNVRISRAEFFADGADVLRQRLAGAP